MKTTKNLFLTLLSLVLVVSLQAQPGQGQGPRDGRGPGNGPQEGRWMQALNLTDAQQTQIDQLRTAHLSEMQDIRAQLKIKEAELDAAMIKEDSKKANALTGEINDLHVKLMSNRVAHQLEVKGLLDDDQKVLFDEFVLNHDRGNRRAPKGDGYGPGNGDRPGRPKGRGYSN